MSPRPLFITEADVRRTLTPADSNRLVESCFRALGRGAFRMPAKVYLQVPDGDFRAMPSYGRIHGGIAGIKWISVFPENARRGLPTVIGTLLLNDVRTGRLLAQIEANTLTAYRTGSAGAVASGALGRPRPRVLGLVGAGVQAEFQLRCHLARFRFEKVLVWSPDPAEVRAFVRRAGRSAPARPAGTLEACVRQADILCTCTPSRKPLVRAGWVRGGTHINAIGADAPGKEELEGGLLGRSRVFVDDWEQASHSGEINVPFSRGRFTRRDLAGTLTDTLLGRAAGRKRADDITVFDSTGLAVQDLVLADHVYRKIRARKDLPAAR
jgi:alanine dehydrogenase